LRCQRQLRLCRQGGQASAGGPAAPAVALTLWALRALISCLPQIHTPVLKSVMGTDAELK
jgi:hypothetical protein